MPQFFINRPVFAWVVALFILLAGALAIPQLPVAQYPNVAPPQVEIYAVYPGASAATMDESVVSLIEQELNGADNLLYFESQSSLGSATITATFEPGTHPDLAQVDVQNRLKVVESRLPRPVTQQGLQVEKVSTGFLLLGTLTSEDGTLDETALSDILARNVMNEIRRLKGVGKAQLYGSERAMRIWIDPARLIGFNLTPNDVAEAIAAQNAQVAPGSIGDLPARSTQEITANVVVKGQLSTPEEFAAIVLRANQDGSTVTIGDVARVEIGAQEYQYGTRLNGKPASAFSVQLAPGANAMETATLVRAKMQELSRYFPEGVKYDIPYDTSPFVKVSIQQVISTLFEAMLLVFAVMFLFLQNLRYTLIPTLVVPVALMGTFAVMLALGFSVNVLTLFGMVLAIGILVDDAIVVVENVERNIGLGLNPVEATKRAMREVTGPIIATALVLCAVFVPAAFISGLTGQFYKQFALTIAISTVISAFNSLTLSPALAAVLLKDHHAPKDGFSKFLDKLLGGWLFKPFNRFFDRASGGYVGTVRRVIRGSGIALFLYAGLMVLTWFGFAHTPMGFVPAQDKQYLVAFAQLPDAASLDRTEDVIKRMSDIALKQPGVESAVAFPGLSINGFTNSPNNGIVFVTLKPFDERKDPSMSAGAIAGALNGKYADIQEAYMAIFPPPPVQGLGTIGGFRLQVEDRSGMGYEELYKEVQNVIAKSRSVPELAGLFTSYQVNVPQVDAAIDREKAKTHGVAISDIFDTLQVYLGSLYANDFNRFGRTYQVNVQAEQQFRLEAEQIGQLKVRNNKGEMITLATFIKVSDTAGPDRVMHYNGFVTAEINGAAAPGYSSGQAEAAIEKLLKEELPNGMTYEWTELTYQQILAGNTALFVFPLCVLLAFLVLAAQYESWSLPLAVILIVPMTLLSAIAGVILSGGDNNIFTQIGLIVLVGLACKNAILIVEFAKDKQEEGLDPLAAVLEACRLRLRPILMTSFAFIMGVVPLVFSSGAGAEMRHAMGVAVFSGMLGVTFFGLLLTPVFYVLIRNYVERSEARKATRALKLEAQQ